MSLPELIPWRSTLDWLVGLRLKLRLQSFVLCGCFVLSRAGYGSAQQDGLTIRVEARQVLVPFGWDDAIYCKKARDVKLLKCWWGDAVNNHVSREAYSRGELNGPVDLGLLSLKDLHIFEDGIEQHIESVGTIPWAWTVVVDNLGSHVEAAWLPAAIWSKSDSPADTKYIGGGLDYQIAYSPPVSTEGSCHSILITGPRATKLMYRKEYCYVVHPTSDPLKGSPDDRKLEEYLAAGKQGSIHPKMQGNSFLLGPGKARATVDIEFPLDEVKPKDWKGLTLPTNLLILAYGEGGQIIARHSEMLPGDPHPGSDPLTSLEHEQAEIFVRYDAQMELPPGNYKLAFAYSHGPDFGIAEVPLSVDRYDGSQLTISSIALCKRVRKVGKKPIAKDFVPLVAGGEEFTPAADTDFRYGDTLMAYFELYEPSTGQPQQGAFHASYTMRIRNEQNGAVALEQVKSADSWIQPGKAAIPIAEMLVLSQLHLAPGKYRMEIQATDSVGSSTPLRTAEFWID